MVRMASRTEDGPRDLEVGTDFGAEEGCIECFGDADCTDEETLLDRWLETTEIGVDDEVTQFFGASVECEVCATVDFRMKLLGSCDPVCSLNFGPALSSDR
jgi:hypothetical protein